MENVDQNKRISYIEGITEDLNPRLEDAFEDIDDVLKDLKATDDIIKSDITRKVFRTC